MNRTDIVIYHNLIQFAYSDMIHWYLLLLITYIKKSLQSFFYYCIGSECPSNLIYKVKMNTLLEVILHF